MLTTQGLKGEVISITPILGNALIATENGPMPSDDKLDRGDEIKMWLNYWPNEVESFVIIDDILFNGFSQFPDNCVIIDSSTGILPKHAERAIAILNQVS